MRDSEEKKLPKMKKKIRKGLIALSRVKNKEAEFGNLE